MSSDNKVMDAMRHRCPLFSRALGTSPTASLAIDSLHCLYYGPIMRWVSAAIWRLILVNPFGFSGGLEEVLDLGCKRILADLLVWQDQHDVPHQIRLTTLNLKMLGKRK
eukprot:1681733-Pyramimonas_sp.AAC.1